jgi:hypothetical protein
LQNVQATAWAQLHPLWCNSAACSAFVFMLVYSPFGYIFLLFISFLVNSYLSPFPILFRLFMLAASNVFNCCTVNCRNNFIRSF